MSYRVFGDWGTTRLRLFRVEDGRITHRLEGSGIGRLTAPPETVLRETLAPWRRDGEPDAIVFAGMVGSRNGWREVDYVACPAGPEEWAGGSARLLLDEIPVLIAPGLSCIDHPKSDVMRGEETQIFGALVNQPDLAIGRHHMVLPGTHSKWAMIDGGRIARFATVLTGELFALLHDHSTLLRAGFNAAVEEGGTTGFAAGLARAMSGAPLLSTLFEVRTSQLLGGRSLGWASDFLSGLLIGSEIAAVAPTIQDSGAIYIIGEPALAARYETALCEFGQTSSVLNAEACVVRGLSLLEKLQ